MRSESGGGWWLSINSDHGRSRAKREKERKENESSVLKSTELTGSPDEMTGSPDEPSQKQIFFPKLLGTNFLWLLVQLNMCTLFQNGLEEHTKPSKQRFLWKTYLKYPQAT